MITFQKKGLLTTVQDLGRIGYQRYGMPVCGAMDHYAMELANILVGNPRSEAVIEATVMGPTIVFDEAEYERIRRENYPEEYGEGGDKA